nr:hypothetical protein [uncultured Psychroserpens sp.]
MDDYYGSTQSELIGHKIKDIKRIILLWKSAENIKVEVKRNIFSKKIRAYWMHNGQWAGIEEKIYST